MLTVFVDQADVAIVPPVHDRGATGVEVGEEEEPVAEQVHALRRLLGRHRHHGEPLGLHDVGTRAVGRLLGRGTDGVVGGSADGGARGHVVAPLELRLELVELLFELGDGPVDGDEAVGGVDLAPDVVAVPFERDLAGLALGDPGVALLGEVHLGPVHAVEEAVQAADLLLGHDPEAVWDVGVPAADGHLHEAVLLGRRAVIVEDACDQLSGCSGVRAATTPTTAPAPPARRAWAAAPSDAPVVNTSSTTAIVAPSRWRVAGSGARCGPRWRSARPRPVWGGPGSRSSKRTHGTPSSRATAVA